VRAGQGSPNTWPDFPSEPGARPRDPTSEGPKEKPDNEPDKTKAAQFRGGFLSEVMAGHRVAN
jgi:hypothetical protein